MCYNGTKEGLKRISYKKYIASNNKIIIRN
jgi:hypothetical protein